MIVECVDEIMILSQGREMYQKRKDNAITRIGQIETVLLKMFMMSLQSPHQSVVELMNYGMVLFFCDEK